MPDDQKPDENADDQHVVSITHAALNTRRDELFPVVEGLLSRYLTEAGPVEELPLRIVGAMEALSVLAYQLEERARDCGVDGVTIMMSRARASNFCVHLETAEQSSIIAPPPGFDPKKGGG